MGKIIHKENYMKRNNVGEDLFLANQVMINLDTEEWIQLSFRSRVFLKNFISGNGMRYIYKFASI